VNRSYERLEVEPFGRFLLQSNDLDPVYVALAGAELGGPTLRRWLLAYWCYYHAGAASWMSEREGSDFWDAMLAAARNQEPAPVGGRWPRGHDRRHFRGAKAVEAVERLRARYGPRPEDMAEYCASGGPATCAAVMKRVKEHFLFGPWVGFKIADMCERVLRAPISFEHAEVFMFDSPAKAARILWDERVGAAEPDHNAVNAWAVDYLAKVFADQKAPPWYDRPVGLQEIETILCCWKSHRSGHYPLWNDIDEINDGLRAWVPHSAAARGVAEAMPKRQGVDGSPAETFVSPRAQPSTTPETRASQESATGLSTASSESRSGSHGAEGAFRLPGDQPMETVWHYKFVPHPKGRGRTITLGYAEVDGESRKAALVYTKHSLGGWMLNLDEYEQAKEAGAEYVLLQNSTSGLEKLLTVEEADRFAKAKQFFSGPLGDAVIIDPHDVGFDDFAPLKGVKL
jgi:amino acid-DNA transferase-like protein